MTDQTLQREGRVDVFATEAEWLAARRKGVGSSDIARIVFGSGHKEYLEKATGESFFDGDDVLAEFGHRSEPLNAKWFADKKGCEIEDPGEYTLRWHNSLPMFATVDRFVIPDVFPVSEPEVLELKAAFGDLAYLVEKVKTEDLRHSKLERFYWQIQHQLACTGLSLGYLSVIYFTGYSCGHRWFKCQRDEKVIRAIEKRVTQFWQCVETNTPPDWQAATSADQDAIRKSMQPANGNVVELSGEQEFTMFQRLDDLNQKRLSVTKECDDLKAKFTALMAERGASKVVAGGREIDFTKKRFTIKDHRDNE